MTKSRNLFLWVFLTMLLPLFASCRDQNPESDSRLKWGVHNTGLRANLLNLRPQQSVEVCADSDEWISFAHDAIGQWAGAIGRAPYIKVLNCGQGADLTINMHGFGETGLNYFNERPGRVYISSRASGDYAHAIVLHEFGHSFGMCDQYKDAGSANCSDSRSERQQNNEVMGVTTPKKLKLTPGDIEGVQTAANNMSVKTNQEWKNFLANVPATPGAAEPVYVSLVDAAIPLAPKIAISVAQGAVPLLCRDSGGASVCEQGQAGQIKIVKSNSVGDRDIYVTDESYGELSSTGRDVFITTIRQSSEVKSSKFAITKK